MPLVSAKALMICRPSTLRISPVASQVWKPGMPQPPDAAPSQARGPETGAALATKLAIELGPLLVFFAANFAAGIYAATAAFMAVTFVALGVAWWRYHKVPMMLLVSAVVVLVFGTLTLYL